MKYYRILQKYVAPLSIGLFLIAQASAAPEKELSITEIVTKNPPPQALAQVDLAKSKNMTLLSNSQELANKFVRVHWENKTNEKKERSELSDDYVVAVYTVGYFLSSWVRVFHLGPKEGQFQVAYDLPFNIDGNIAGPKQPVPTPPDFFPIFTLDVDGDKIPEVIVTTVAERGGYNGRWVFRWDGKSLLPMTSYDYNPRYRSGALAQIPSAKIEDLSGSGKIDLISQVSSSKRGINPDGSPPFDLLNVYRLTGTQYSVGEQIYYYRSFAQGEPMGSWRKPFDTFRVADLSKSYVLTVVDGHPKADGDLRIEVSVNGKSVTPPSTPNKVTKWPQSFPIQVTNELDGRNSIQVKILSKEKGRVAIFVEEKK